MNVHLRGLPACLLAGVACATILGSSCARNPTPVSRSPRPRRRAPNRWRRRRRPRLGRGPSSPAVPPHLPPLPEEEVFATRPLEEINREAPLQPVFFGYDSSELDAVGRNRGRGQRGRPWRRTPRGWWRSRDTAIRGARPSTIWRSANAVRTPFGTTWSASGLRRTGSRPSATARSSRSSPVRPRMPGRPTGAPTSSSPDSETPPWRSGVRRRSGVQYRDASRTLARRFPTRAEMPPQVADQRETGP